MMAIAMINGRCSPRLRGWTGGFALADKHGCVFPAFAGMDRS